MDKFNDYINEHVMPEKGIEENWVYNTLTVRTITLDNSPVGKIC